MLYFIYFTGGLDADADDDSDDDDEEEEEIRKTPSKQGSIYFILIITLKFNQSSFVFINNSVA